MKRLKLYDKLIWFLNCLAAILLLIGYILPYIPPKHFPIIAALSLALAPLILINIIFFLYWLLKVKMQLWLSVLVLLIGSVNLSALYKVSNSKTAQTDVGLSVMSYNVKLFNKYNWIETQGISDSIVNFVKNEQPDIITLQEYYKGEANLKTEFKYNYIKTKTDDSKFGLAIFSNYKIIDYGSVDFDSKGNNAIYVDILYANDTVRIYNAHFESLKVIPQVEEIQREGSQRLLKRVGQTFKKQQEQVELLQTHMSKIKHKTVICTDMNNSAFSYAYKELKGREYVDAFKEAGNGFGRTYDFNFFPLRIDFILVDKRFTVEGFKTYNTKFSDHFPLKVTLKL